jgi:hypothetical protein
MLMLQKRWNESGVSINKLFSSLSPQLHETLFNFESVDIPQMRIESKSSKS